MKSDWGVNMLCRANMGMKMICLTYMVRFGMSQGIPAGGWSNCTAHTSATFVPVSSSNPFDKNHFKAVKAILQLYPRRWFFWFCACFSSHGPRRRCFYSVWIWLKQLSLSTWKGHQWVSPLFKFHGHVMITIKRNILPVLTGCPLSKRSVSRATLISVMGSALLSLHICLSLFTQCPHLRGIPSTGRPGAAEAPRESSSESAVHPNWNWECASVLIRNFYLPQLGSFYFQSLPCFNYLLKQNLTFCPGFIYPFS